MWIGIHVSPQPESLSIRDAIKKIRRNSRPGALPPNYDAAPPVEDRLYQDRQLDGEGFGRFYKPLEERQKQLETDIPELESEIDLHRVNTISAEEVASEAQALSKRWPKLEPEEKRQIVEAITEKIVIGKGEISITFYHLPSCKEVAKGGGRGGIRTHGRVAPTPDFESGAFNHSATLPLALTYS